MRKIYAYTEKDACPVDEFFSKTNVKIRNKLKFQFEYIKDEHNVFCEPYIKHFSIEKYKQLYEFRIKAAGIMVRVSYTITESRSYPNLADSDTSLVPKTITKDGATLNLTNISWQTAASDNIDGHDLAVRYTAHASYSGTGTKTYTKGYTATAEYKGEVKKVTNDTIIYTAVFNEVPKNGFLSYWWAYAARNL